MTLTQSPFSLSRIASAVGDIASIHLSAPPTSFKPPQPPDGGYAAAVVRCSTTGCPRRFRSSTQAASTPSQPSILESNGQLRGTLRFFDHEVGDTAEDLRVMADL